jgi:beta-glucosidase
MHPYQNSTLGTTDRAADLLAQMTIEEKIAQLCAVIFPWGEANFPAKFNEAGALVKNETYTAQTTHGLGAICYMQFSLNIHESVRYYNTLQRDLIERTRLRIPMLGIDEGAHGHMAQQATSFPIPQGLGATFDPGLVRRVFDCTGREVRVRGGHMALTPVGDIGNDPRWGRVEETFGEETHLVTRMLVAAVQGLQGFSAHGSQVSPDHIAATAKHFAAI